MTIRKRVIVATIAAVGLLFTSASSCDENKSPQASGQKLTEDAFAQQQAAIPYPVEQLRDSLERRNIRERLLRTNNPNKIGYIYLLSFSGDPLGYYTIKGKVSSTDSQMTTTHLVVSTNSAVVDAPGDDGSYGPNESGIFFFTTENAFVTTNLNYVYSDQPLPLDVPKLNVKNN